MRKQLIANIMQCETAYEIMDVWEEVTSHLKTDRIDMNDFITIQKIKYDKLKNIEADEMQLTGLPHLEHFEE
ncbi:MAG: hypothetical protein R3222_03585 [Balneolaceae bacterium]|nr:hypothetical protein [Balneolaceae bacterium]